jgi:hypothetical protein
MNAESKQKFNAVKLQFIKMRDALERAADGFHEENWNDLTLGYVINQLTRVNHASVVAIERINAELNGRMEGAPSLEPPLEDEIPPAD